MNLFIPPVHVDVLGNRGISMPEKFGDRTDVLPFFVHDRRVGMTE